MTRARFLALFSCLVTCLSLHALLVPAGAPALEFSEVVIFATESARIGQGADILAGSVVVNEARDGRTLVKDVELLIDKQATTANSGAVVAADRLKIKDDAVVGGDVMYNDLVLDDDATIVGSQITPLSLPVFAAGAIPPFQTGTPGTMDVTVAKNKVVTLPPGDYRDLTVRGTLILGGGTYNIRSLKVKHKAQLLFDAPTKLRVARRVDTESQVVIGPNPSASLPPSAADIVFYVQGSNGGAGKPDSTPFAVKLGERSHVWANFYVPNGTLRLEKATMATGALLGQHVRIGQQAQISLDSFVAP